MNITNKQLKQIIREEVERALDEAGEGDFSADDMRRWQRQHSGKEARINDCIDKCTHLNDCDNKGRRCMSKCKRWCWNQEDAGRL